MKNKGITLIALVITIIVLLILAGVSIATLTRRKWNTDSSIKSRRRNKKIKCRRTGKVSSTCKL